MPEMVDTSEMEQVMSMEIAPMYVVLDQLKHKANVSGSTGGHSLRNLIGQAQLRHVTSSFLAEVISVNNQRAMREGKYQYVLLLDAKNVDPKYRINAPKLKGNPRLTKAQAINLELNLQLISMEAERHQMEEENDDDAYLE